MKPELLQKRLAEIGHSLEKNLHSLALLGLGSAGLEMERMDEFSDLDFFVLVEPGTKQQFLTDLSWLSSICPIAYAFANTADGYKLLFTDGIFCEFAIFEPSTLETAVYSPGRILWKRPEISESIAISKRTNSTIEKHDQTWLIGEALTNLYVGLGRDRRGEKLSSMRFIQWYAVDRLIELVETLETAQPGFRDEFSAERRFEQRFPLTSQQISGWMQGYAHNRESALSILEFLESHFEINAAMSRAIRDYCTE